MPLNPAFPLLNIRIGGAVANDTWSTGFWNAFNPLATTPTQAQLDTFIAGVLADFQADVWGPGSNPLKGVNPSGVDLRSARGVWYESGSAVVSSVATQTAVAGTGSSGSYHAGAALVVTLLTALAGRRHRGRMYLPVTAPNAAAANLQWAVSPPYAGTMKTFLDHVNARSAPWDGGAGHTVSVVSQVGTAGTVLQVKQLRVNSVIDSQRGRSDKFQPLFVATSTLA